MKYRRLDRVAAAQRRMSDITARHASSAAASGKLPSEVNVVSDMSMQSAKSGISSPNISHNNHFACAKLVVTAATAGRGFCA